MCLQSNFLLAPDTSLLSSLPVSKRQKSLDIDKHFKITSSSEKTQSLYLQRSFHVKEITVWEHSQPLPGLGEEGMLCGEK